MLNHGLWTVHNSASRMINVRNMRTRSSKKIAAAGNMCFEIKERCCSDGVKMSVVNLWWSEVRTVSRQYVDKYEQVIAVMPLEYSKVPSDKQCDYRNGLLTRPLGG